MRIIRFNVNQQRIKNIDSVLHVYSGTDNFLKLEFKFSEDWNGCVKAISLGTKDIAKLLEDDSCIVPKEAFDETQLSFYLVGKKKNYKIQTQKYIIKLGG